MNSPIICALSVCGVGLLIFIGAAPAALADPSDDWTGLYAGVHVGGAFGDADWTNAESNFWGPVGSGVEIDTDGLLGGGQLGYLHQISNIVLGIDVSGSASDVNDTIASPTVAVDTWDAGFNVLFLAQARLGWTQDQWLVFVQGGFAGADAEATGTAPGGPVGAATLWHNGWTVGGGVMLQVDDGISIGAEYNYVDLEEERYNVVAAPPTDLVDVDHEIHVFKFTGTIHLGRLFGGP